MEEVNKLVSIIIRVKNEEKWIGSCLDAVYSQDYKNIEVIIVDNNSTDQTVKKAERYPVKVVTVDEFLPGAAINIGIRASEGEYIVILSGHCIPVNSKWLSNLIRDLECEGVAGVYGRQEPLSFTSSLDKRDLAITFGLDKKIQHKDSFFHNANSAIKRETWDDFPFDEQVTNIEDRVWGDEVIRAGRKIIYEPEASVYHYHGIHQGRNLERAEKIVNIMEKLHGEHQSYSRIALDGRSVVAIVPVKGEPVSAEGETILQFTIDHLKESSYISDVLVSTDSEHTAELALASGASVPFLRPSRLSEDYADISDVLSFSLQKYEETKGIVDLVVIAQETQPFRPDGLIDQMIEKIIIDGLDTIIASNEESRRYWLTDDTGEFQFGEQTFMPRKLKRRRLHVGLMGLGCVTHPTFVRDGSIIGNNLGLHEVQGPMGSVEIRCGQDLLDCLPMIRLLS